MSAAAWDDGMTNPHKEIETLRKRVAESDKTSDEHLNARYLAERQAEKAEAALTEARARLKAADRMAYWLDKLHEEGNGQIAEISQLLYEWEAGQ